APGKRVWVPLRTHKAIGFIVNMHDEQPDFNTRAVERILDEEPVLSPEMLQLSRWVHRFYYCSWGEAIQAALPAGLNFYTEKKLRLASDDLPGNLDEKQREIIDAIGEEGNYAHKVTNKRWGDELVKKKMRRKRLEIRQE